MATGKPMDETYWVEEGRLLAGHYPGHWDEKEARTKLRRFLAAGFDVFIDLTEPNETLRGRAVVPYEPLLQKEAAALGRTVEHRRLSIPDISVPVPSHMRAILDTIDAAVAARRKAFVHCLGGTGRTGTVVGCYLVRRGMNGEQALARVAELIKQTPKARRPSPDNLEQRAFVSRWASEDRVAPNSPAPQLDCLARFRGALLGLAVGDALGTTLEFQPGPHHLADMVGGGPFRLEPGQWTDDTSMALCLAASLVEKHCFDAVDQMNRYVRWWKEGYMSSTGRCFDIGTTTSGALSRFIETGDPYAGSTDPGKAGNGSLMRLAPLPLFFAASPAEAITRAADSSRTTHGAPTAVDACRYMAALIVSAVHGVPKDELLAPRHSPIPGYWREHPLVPEIDAIAAGSFKTRNPPVIRGTGYVVQSLEAALWAFHHGHDFREGALLAVNLGDDADTTGAIYGQIAGAFYGEPGIPPEWLGRLDQREVISCLAEQLSRGVD